jgi:hypothetical protein
LVTDVRCVVRVVKEELGKSWLLLGPVDKASLVVKEFFIDLKALDPARGVKTGVLSIINRRKSEHSIIRTDMPTKVLSTGILLG